MVAGVAAALMLAGCGGDDAPRVVEVRGSATSTTLEVGVDTCNEDPQITASETAQEVRLAVSVNGGHGDDCRDGVTVVLDAPLGDRYVVDDGTDQRVDVQPPE